ncbi:MAG: CRISPR system precrRNA processing endoribonuclease RAMP protein Cas6 [Lachnospiraceae bacterium]|nr:CRISPR system precrRNA processing endoribonuclease RAMP protein Cas6 [Lachnospiraceae bacterium]
MEQRLENALKIRYVKLHFTVALLEDTQLPIDKVSALRGGMGEMLLRANCVRNRDCASCDFADECIVRRTMYSKYENVPQFVTTDDSIGYILECENYEQVFAAGDLLQFRLLLFGKTIVYFNQYMQAFFTLGREGIGKEHARYQIVSVTNTQNELLLAENAVYMQNYQVQTIDEYVNYRIGRIRRAAHHNSLVFHTPAALKYQGKFQEKYDIEAIWNAVLRRIYMLECFEGIADTVYDMKALKDFVLPDIVRQEARRVNVRRYSSTQDRKMVLSGIKGYVLLDMIPEQMLPLLLAGELIHIGKNTSFGFGRYSVV